MARDPSLDITLYCDYTDVHGKQDAGIPIVSLTMHGTWLNVTIFADPITVDTAILGTWSEGVLVTSPDTVIEVSLGFGTGLQETEFYTEASRANWVQWSNIGEMDFTKGRDNVAGERPLDWASWVYNIRKMKEGVVAYGKNGVSLLIPQSNVGDRGQISRVPIANTYGLNTIYRVGLKGKMAMDGSDTEHFFIDNLDQLCRLDDEGFKILDYSEYISNLGDDLVLTFDKETGLLYICDDTYGYIYNSRSDSFGQGPVNVSGIGAQSGVTYIASPAAISTPNFEVWTDIIDVGTRKSKTIYSIETGVNLTIDLYASIKYRNDKANSFSQTHWQYIDPHGIAYIFCYCHEFMIGLKTTEYEYFEIDYLNIRGVINDH